MSQYFKDVNKIEYSTAEQIVRVCDWLVGALLASSGSEEHIKPYTGLSVQPPDERVRRAWQSYDYTLLKLASCPNYNTKPKWIDLLRECHSRLWLYGRNFQRNEGSDGGCCIMALNQPMLTSNHAALEMSAHRLIHAGMLSEHRIIVLISYNNQC